MGLNGKLGDSLQSQCALADADFGYVGSKPGMIDLYVGKQCVERDINFADPDDRLVDLIKKQGRWVEPEVVSETILTL